MMPSPTHICPPATSVLLLKNPFKGLLSFFSLLSVGSVVFVLCKIYWGGHSLHDAQSYSHLYLQLKDPLQGSLSFSFFIGIGIMVSDWH